MILIVLWWWLFAIGIVVEILSIPAKDWNKSPVPLPAAIALKLCTIIEKHINKKKGLPKQTLLKE